MQGTERSLWRLVSEQIKLVTADAQLQEAERISFQARAGRISRLLAKIRMELASSGPAAAPMEPQGTNAGNESQKTQ